MEVIPIFGQRKEKKMLKFEKGDLFKSIPSSNTRKILIPHCMNTLGVAGAGFIKPLVHFSELPRDCYYDWHRKLYNYVTLKSSVPFGLGECQIVNCHNNVSVANMIGQEGTVSIDNPVPVKYWAVAKCMKWIQEMITTNEIEIDEIRAPFFCTGLAQGRKDFIETLIKEIWVDVGIPVTIYEL